MPCHFADIHDADYRVVAHCLERPELPAGVPASLLNLILNWLDKNPARRMVGYNLSALQADVSEYEVDFSEHMDVRQIKREYSYIHLAARHGIPYA